MVVQAQPHLGNVSLFGQHAPQTDPCAARQEVNGAATDLALLLFKDYVRRWLMKTQGYECQEAEGEFMLAFTSPLLAVHFCLLVRACQPAQLPPAIYL